MTEFENLLEQSPDACTLPTVDRPLRMEEFSSLFTSAVEGAERPTSTSAILTLPAWALESARDLAARETECCSFFEFTIEPVDGHTRMNIEVPEQYADVLTALLGLTGRVPA